MTVRTVSASMMMLATLSACSRAPATETPTNEAPALAEAARTVSDQEPSSGEAVATPETPPPLPLPPQRQAMVAPPPVADLPADEALINADDGIAPFPAEVTDFMVARDGCDHFRGEDPYDADRRAYLEDSIRQLCAGTDARLADLRRRYRADDDVLAALKGYEDKIETPPNE